MNAEYYLFFMFCCARRAWMLFGSIILELFPKAFIIIFKCVQGNSLLNSWKSADETCLTF